MTNFDPLTLDWTAAPLTGWTYDREVNKWFQGEFRRAHRLHRVCPTCREPITIEVTRKALEGTATNHGLSLRRCKKCRQALKQTTVSDEYAERKALGEQRRAAEPEEIAELERLQKENEKLKTVNVSEGSMEIDGYRVRETMYLQSIQALQEQIAVLGAEIKKLKTQLAKYDLPAAIAAQNQPFDPARLLAEDIARGNTILATASNPISTTPAEPTFTHSINGTFKPPWDT